MKFIIDNALSPEVAKGLIEVGHSAAHVRDMGLQDASDNEIFDRAAAEDRVLVSADTDFGTLLATRRASKPSVILFRGFQHRRPSDQLRSLILNLPSIGDFLDAGAVVVFEKSRIRIRELPFA